MLKIGATYGVNCVREFLPGDSSKFHLCDEFMTQNDNNNNDKCGIPLYRIVR